jgi:uncharacterized iron-regulated membrane protein
MWKPVRKLFNDIHLYAGLTCGLIVIAVCLSGTIYVYNSEIREFADSERYYVKKEGVQLSLDQLKSLVESSLDGEVVGVNVYHNEDRSVQFSLKKEGEEKPTTYFVNPFTAEILADNKEKTSTEEFMGYMFSLHRWLLLDKVEEPILESMGNRDLGRFINGVATLLFLLGVLTGMVIWFPKKVKNWKQGLKINWSGNWKRLNHDLHNTLAFYSLFALFIMAVTGPFWSYQWYKEGWQKTWDIYQAPTQEESGGKAEKSNEKEDALSIGPEVVTVPPVSLDRIFEVGNQNLNYTGFLRISLPSAPGDDISISKSKTGFFARSGSDQLTLDGKSLEVKELKLFSDLSVRQQIGRSVKALHTGEIFGQFTKFLWFLGCLVATSLPISGTLIWWNKRKKKAKYLPKKSFKKALASA